MAKRIILAVAGAGKTYYICHSLQPNAKNLILAYTRENIRNIKRELQAAHGCIPDLTSIMTFDSFVYRYLLCPYEPSILKFFNREDFSRKGITTQDPPPQTLKRNGNSFTNPSYKKKDILEHYINKRSQYYCATLSELIILVKENKQPLIKKAARSLNLFFDQIMIDEFQDFREYDYELIISLAKEVENVLLVGDYYQHSVSATNNSGKPFKLRKNEVSYADFKQTLIKLGMDIDETTLSASRRCPKEICEYIQHKLQIHICANNEHCGQVIWIEKDIATILENDNITKLVFHEASKYSFNSVNWSYSKGDTMEHACVILTEKFNSLDQDTFSLNGISTSTINKLYVAMTRTKGNLYLVKSKTFQKVKGDYLK